jgi:hypothetical protein
VPCVFAYRSDTARQRRWKESNPLLEVWNLIGYLSLTHKYRVGDGTA